MILVYGNKYTENREEWHRQKPSNDFMEGVILTYLESVEHEYIYDGELPNDWYSTAFWYSIAEID